MSSINASVLVCRFSGRETCENQCKRHDGYNEVVPPTPDHGGGIATDDPCHQPPDHGPCKHYMPKYYYRAADHACVQFIYGGCGGMRLAIN